MKTTLTPRELEIARLGADGFSDLQIACVSSIQENTVHSHFKNIYNKTGLNRATLWKIFNQHEYNATSDHRMMDMPEKHLWAIQTHKSESFKLCEFFYTEDEAAEAFKNIHAYRKEGITL